MYDVKLNKYIYSHHLVLFSDKHGAVPHVTAACWAQGRSYFGPSMIYVTLELTLELLWITEIFIENIINMKCWRVCARLYTVVSCVAVWNCVCCWGVLMTARRLLSAHNVTRSPAVWSDVVISIEKWGSLSSGSCNFIIFRKYVSTLSLSKHEVYMHIQGVHFLVSLLIASTGRVRKVKIHHV